MDETSLNDILSAIMAVESRHPDAEGSHKEADLLLIKTIVLLKSRCSSVEQDALDAIIDGWERLDKWYA